MMPQQAEETRGIYWIVTFAKSGSNWFRIFLDNLIENGEKPIDIFRSSHIHDYKNRRIFDLHTGLDSASLTVDEIDEIRPQLYRHLAIKEKKPLFVKLHSAYAGLPSGQKIVPAEVTKGAIYLIRNPLDIAASWASHFGVSIDETINIMANDESAFDGDGTRFEPHLKQKLLSWSHHVESWTTLQDFPVHLVRYEDMISNPVACFSRAAEFAGLNCKSDEIQRALKHASFDETKRQEKAAGVTYMKVRSDSFFRSGKKGGWRNELSNQQIERIIDNHGEVMKRFGYLDENNEPNDFLIPVQGYDSII